MPSLSAPPEDAHDLAFFPLLTYLAQGKAPPNFGQGIAGHLHALMIAQLGGSFTTKNQWQQVSVGFSGDRVAPLTSMAYALGTFSAFMLSRS